jgi:ELWxxDGT repeat protein
MRPTDHSTKPVACADLLEARRLLAASPVELVKDIDPRTFGSMAEIDHELVTIGSVAYFNPGTKSTPDGERELWRTDGTEAGTWMVKDIVPGDRGSSPQNLTPVGNTLFFKAPAPGVLPEVYRVLWRSDGTDAGTVVVRDGAGQPVVTDRILGALDARRVVFVSGFSTTERRLWVSDGTSAGTHQLLSDLSEAWFGPGEYAAAIGQFFFVNAGTLWCTDGTEAGTRLVKDIRPGPGNDIHDLTAAANWVYFAGNDGTSGYDLWFSNGSAAGTFKVKDLPNNPNNGADVGPTPMTWTGNTLYFMIEPGATELWKSNGTAAGTVRVKELALSRLTLTAPAKLFSAGLRAYYADLAPGNQWKLWTTNGTASGTHVVDNAAGDLTIPNGFQYVTNDVGGRLFFNGVTPATGEELWSTDGTTAGTRIVRDALPGPASGAPKLARAATDRLYFAPDDLLVGREPWVSDATEAGTRLVRDVNRQPYGGGPYLMRRSVGRVNFFGWNLDQTGLWRSDGTTAGTSFVAPLQSGALFNAPATNGAELSASLGDLYLFSGNPVGSTAPPRLYRSDGTAGGHPPARLPAIRPAGRDPGTWQRRRCARLPRHQRRPPGPLPQRRHRRRYYARHANAGPGFRLPLPPGHGGRLDVLQRPRRRMAHRRHRRRHPPAEARRRLLQPDPRLQVHRRARRTVLLFCAGTPGHR